MLVFKNNQIIVALLVLFNLAIFANGLNNDFVWDDSYLVEDNQYIRDAGNIKKLLTMEDKPATFSGTGYFRPLINLTYLLDYQLYGGKPYGFRLTNILFNIACVVMLFYLVLLITSDQLLAAATALIFSAQAVHVEAVTWISGRNNIICMFFILPSLYYYIKNSRDGKKSHLVYSMLFLFLGAASKEFAFVLPALFVLYDYCFDDDFSLRKNVSKYAIAFATLFAFMLYRTLTVPMKGAFRLESASLYKRIITTVGIFLDYMRNQIIPNKLSIYFSMPLEESILAPKVIISSLLLVALLVFVFLYRKKEKALFFSLFAYFLLLAPVSNIIKIPGALMADRWLYPASAMFSLFLARLIFIACKKSESLKFSIIIIFVIFLSLFTVQRNHTFKNNLLLFADVLARYPESPDALNNIGVELMERGLDDEAEGYYLQSLKHDPKYNLPYYNLGIMYDIKADKIAGSNNEQSLLYREKALEYLHKAYELNEKYAPTAFSIAKVNDGMENPQESIKYYNISIKLNPQDYSSYYNLGANYYNQGEYGKAISTLNDALKITYDKHDREELKKKIKMMTDVMYSETKDQ